MQLPRVTTRPGSARRRSNPQRTWTGVEPLEQRLLLAATYDWQSAQVGGGGFVTGVLFSPSQRGLAYARTDVGGAYRWDAGAGRWTALNDFQPDSELNSAGVESIALDPSDASKFYMTCGTYGLTATWGPMGILYKSSDQGRSLTRITLPFKVAGNNEGRGNGERMMVDPHNGSTLYYGSRSWVRNSDGATIPAQLWKSADGGSTWSVVGSFPSVTSTTGFNFIEFDKNVYSASGTQVIYVGLAQKGSVGANLYRSTDGGSTWTAIIGAGTLPSTSFMPMREALTPDGSTLYVTYASGTGPSDATSGGVWKLSTATNSWTKITPTSPSQAATAGYEGISVDPQAPNTIVVSTPDLWSPQNLVFRSTDGGATWRDVRTTAVLDASSAPYAAGVNPHWMSDIKIDPFDSNHAIVNTGYGLWSINDLGNANLPTQQPTHWSFNSQNLEETVVSDVISPSVGPHLLVVHGDYDGFVINDPTVNSAAGAVRFSPTIGSEQRLDFAENAPATIVRGGNGSPYGYLSTNSGGTWTAFANRPANVNGIGSVALSADGKRIVWSPAFSSSPGIYYSTDNGQHWTKSTAPITGGTLVADRANASKFYLYTGNANLYVSTNGGASFGAAIGAGRNISTLQATPGIEGDLWMSSSGLYHSTNSGTTWTRVASSTVSGMSALGFGKAAPGKSYPAMYLYGNVSGISSRQIYRSDDAGVNWTRINDDAHQYVGEIAAISGDPRIYGRVYLGTGVAGGRGTIYADLYSGLPAGWSDTDIGSPALAGLAAVGADPGVTTWISTAGGSGIGGSSDQFNFNRRSLTGDGIAIVHVDRVDTSDNGALAGLMFRDSANANAMYAMIAATANNGLVFSYRRSTGGAAGSVTVATPSSAAWLKLVRSGNSFSAWYATSTSAPAAGNWIALGSAQTIPMASSALAGLATSSHNPALTTTAVFSSLSITGAPTVATAATATPSPVTGTTTTLSVLGADDAGEAALTYTWATTGTPPAAVTFSANGTNAAKTTLATFTRAGTYNFKVTITNPAGLSATSTVAVTVSQTLTSITVTPDGVGLPQNSTCPFAAGGFDQFGRAMLVAPSFTWSATGGSIDGSGLLTTGTVAGAYGVTASSGGIFGSAGYTLWPAAPASVVFQVNSGAIQRSMVQGLTVAFDEPVTLAAEALSLSLRGGTIAFATTITNPSGDGRSYLLSFSGSGIIAGSLPDGVYTLNVVAGSVQDAYGQTLTGGDRVFTFHRLFGDVDGNRVVNALDYAKLKATYGRSSTDAPFNPAFDYEGNNVINALDLAQFRKRYGLSFSY